MIGHEAVIDARCMGRAPKAVWIECGAKPSYDEGITRVHMVVIEDGDIPAKLDLRFVHALRVHVWIAGWTAREEGLIDRVRQFKPADLYVHHAGGLIHYGDELTEIA